MKNSFLLTLDEVKKLGGTYYVELQNHALPTELKTDGFINYSFWENNSIYIHGYTWSQYFEILAKECIPNYDFLEIFNVNLKDCQNFAKRLNDIAFHLNKVNRISDLEKECFYSLELKLPYFSLLDEKVFDTSMSCTDFRTIILTIQNSFYELSNWLN